MIVIDPVLARVVALATMETFQAPSDDEDSSEDAYNSYESDKSVLGSVAVQSESVWTR